MRKKGGDADKVQRQEAEETKSRQQFDTITSEYAHRMSDSLSEVQSTVSNGLINYFREYNSACRNGMKLWSDLEPGCKKYIAERSIAKKAEPKDDKAAENKSPSAGAGHVLSAASSSGNHVSAAVPVLGGQAPEIEKQVKQGYLWVKNKKKGGGFKKRWVSVINGRLQYYKNWKTNVPKETFNLVMCSVKRWEDSTRPFSFELQSADMRNLVFCANEEKDLQHWLDVINGIITSLFNAMNSGGSAPGASGATEENNAYAELMEIKGNEVCADCARPDPDWAVMNHGITICIECSGVHRSLGVHISKVRSLKLDMWEPELLLMMKSIGNVKSNASVYEAALADKDRIPPNADRARREAFIKAKYADKKWVPPVASASAIVSVLVKKKRSVPVVSIMKLLCQGADPNWQDPDEGVSLLHRCAADDNITAVELLFTVGAKLDIQDKLGQTPLHYAAKDDAPAAIRLLLTHGANTEVVDTQGKTPLQVARESNSVDAIALLDYNDESSTDVSTPRVPELPPRRRSKFNLNVVGSPDIRVMSDVIGGSPRKPDQAASTSALLSPREKARARRTMTFAEDAKSREEFLKALENGASPAPSNPITKSPSGENLPARTPSNPTIPALKPTEKSPRQPRSDSSATKTDSPAAIAAVSPVIRNLTTSDSSGRRRGISESSGARLSSVDSPTRPIGTSSGTGSSSKDKDKHRDKDKTRSKDSKDSHRDKDRERDKDKDKDKDRDRDRIHRTSSSAKPRHHERQTSGTSNRSASSLSGSGDAIAAPEAKLRSSGSASSPGDGDQSSSQ